MDKLVNELLQILEKTTVLVEFDRDRKCYMNYDQLDAEAGLEPDEEDYFFLYTVRVDGYSDLTKYSKRLDSLIDEFSKNAESQISNKTFHKEIKIHLEKIKSVVLPIYSRLDLVSLLDKIDLKIEDRSKKGSLFYPPNIYVKYINGSELDSDFQEFNIIRQFLETKFYLAQRVQAIVNSCLELLKNYSVGKEYKSFKFKEEGLLDSPRFTNFRKGLIDNKLIDKIDSKIFTKCFSGKECDERINWSKSQLSIVYFVRQLSSNNLIDNRDQWITLSNSFLWHEETIAPEKFRIITTLPGKVWREIIDELIKGLMPIKHTTSH